MPNGDELNDQLEFEERVKAMSADDRGIFTAKQIYLLTNKMDTLDKKVENLNGIGPNKKTVAATSGATAAFVVAIIEGMKILLGR